MKKLNLIIILVAISSVANAQYYKTKNATQVVSREKCKWLSSIDISSTTIRIRDRGGIYYIKDKQEGEGFTYYKAESQFEVIGVYIYPNGNGKLDLLTTGSSISFTYAN